MALQEEGTHSDELAAIAGMRSEFCAETDSTTSVAKRVGADGLCHVCADKEGSEGEELEEVLVCSLT